MISKRELIYNMEIIGDKNMIINGSLLSEIERIMEEYAQQKVRNESLHYLAGFYDVTVDDIRTAINSYIIDKEKSNESLPIDEVWDLKQYINNVLYDAHNDGLLTRMTVSEFDEWVKTKIENLIVNYVKEKTKEDNRKDFCLWYYAQSQPLDANRIFEWFNDFNMIKVDGENLKNQFTSPFFTTTGGGDEGNTQFPKSEVTDEDIEAWAESKEPLWRTDVDTERYYRGRVLGAKAMRDGKITNKQ